MKKTAKTLFVVLVVSCLALSSLMASPNTWAWVGSSRSSETLTAQEETLTEEAKTSEMESTSSENISEVVEVIEEEDGYVLVKKSDLAKAVGKFESAAGFTAKAKASVAEAKADLEDSATAYVAPAPASKFEHFMTLDAEHGFEQDLKLGLSYGFIFKDCLIGQMGVMKKANLHNWMDKTEYTARVSLGIVF